MAAAIALIGVDGVIGLVDARPPHRAAAAAIVAGPSRLVRWAGIAMPLISRLRR